MGPVVVANMVQSGIGEPSSSKLHPFFSKGTSSNPNSTPSTPSYPHDTRLPGTGSHTPTFEARDGDPPAKRHKPDRTPSQDATGVVNPPPIRTPGVPGVPTRKGGLLDTHELFSPSQITQQANTGSTPGQDELRYSLNPPSGSYETHADTAPIASPAAPMELPERNVPSLVGRKVLKLNPRTGTLGSPPKTKAKSKRSLIVCIKYGRDEESKRVIGDKITRILDGSLKLPKTPTKQRSNEKPKKSSDMAAAAKSSTCPKVTHPFFSGKTKARSSTSTQPAESATKSPPQKNTVFMSTPVSPSKPKNPFLSGNTPKMPPLGIKSGGTKVPGAKHPMWPAQGMSHIRGYDVNPVLGTEVALGSFKKSKGQVTRISPNESVLAVVAGRINVDGMRRNLPQDSYCFSPAPAELRIPQKLCESGRQLQQQIRHQLTISSPLALAGREDPSADELAGPAPVLAHPAITHLYMSLETHLSAYDKSTCERLSWNQKYAPVSADQVLQKHQDALHIKQWLEAMKVQSVETSGADPAGDKGRPKAETIPRKKRRKNKVDDFIVDTDEEGSELEELPGIDEEEDGISGADKKSVLRSGGTRIKEPGRLRNCIVISGPHGCGKSAAVYAIARELNFEIFEISSSSRRSGKDILEKVGDMTRNHLVQRHRAQGASTDTEGNGDKESKSGKQGTMTSFFKAKTPPEKKESPKQQAGGQTPRLAPKGQKQSLILIEEGDILYEEDKQFWAVLMSMMNQSRRPFVITCNDERLIPLQSLNLHGIFRFSPAPMPLAVDLCLLIAANEGHSLRRSAVESLYRARAQDLRATISDLNFWCQIGVGDRRGGFDWFYTRWPKGCDLDERGDVVRVISENTYQNGMGWIGRDAILSECDEHDREVEALQQSWNFWQVDMGDWCESGELEPVAKAACDSAAMGSGKRVAILEDLDQFYQAMSDADICSTGTCATSLQEQIDPSLPELSSKAKDDFIIGRTLLEADGYAGPDTASQAIAMALKSQARTLLRTRLRDTEASSNHTGLSPMDEAKAISKLESSFQGTPRSVTRMDLAFAFDPIAVAPKAPPASHLDASVFDRTTRLIVLDVAPWIRGIVAFENHLMEERQRLSNILSDGGTRKRMRNTRSAYSALEGGERRSTRREQYFGDCLTTGLVMRTGGSLWQNAVAESLEGQVVAAPDPGNMVS